MMARLRDVADVEKAVDRAIGRVDLLDAQHRSMETYSRGMRQRMRLAATLVHDPELLILDEPFSGLDPIAVETMKDLLREQLDRGVTVLLSSHQLDLVSDVCRDVVIVRNGQVVLEGAVDELRAASPVREVSATLSAGDLSTFAPPDPSWEVRSRSELDIELRVPSNTDPAKVFDVLRATGPIVAFSIGAPELSEVFIASVGGADTRRAVGSPA
jgi:ABC-2 type transport system ATP-binding protein